MIKAKLLSGLVLPVIIAGLAFLVTGCEKDLQKISASEVSKPLERYTSVDIIYSDSAKVKAHMTSPLMLDYTKVAKPYTEMPKGVKVVFYDANMKENGTITSEYAIRHVIEKTIELQKNVVGTNAKGETFNSEELILDESTKQISSNTVVHVKMTDGSSLDGTSFVSDENLTHWKFGNAHGDIHVNNQEISH